MTLQSTAAPAAAQRQRAVPGDRAGESAAQATTLPGSCRDLAGAAVPLEANHILWQH